MSTYGHYFSFINEFSVPFFIIIHNALNKTVNSMRTVIKTSNAVELDRLCPSASQKTPVLLGRKYVCYST